MSRYEDIINLPHHVSKNRRPMPMENRAAQFAPFAALVGYDDAISEATRLTDARTMLSSDEMEELSQCLNQALEISRKGTAIPSSILFQIIKRVAENTKPLPAL